MKRKILWIFIILVSILNFNMIVRAEDVYNNYEDDLVSCGEKLISDIPSSIPTIIHIIYLIVQIAVPVVLVILGTLDLFKGITAQKEDEIKKGQQTFIKRLIGAVIIFFVFTIVKLLVGTLSDSSNSNRIISCVECFINDNESCKKE